MRRTANRRHAQRRSVVLLAYQLVAAVRAAATASASALARVHDPVSLQTDDAPSAARSESHGRRFVHPLGLSWERRVASLGTVANEATRITATNTTAATIESKTTCTPKGVCEMCTASDRSAFPACSETGRKQQFECRTTPRSDTASELHEASDSIAWTTEVRSCSRTQADESFLMIQFLITCLIVGVVAMISVRRQKRLNASLFDQRKYGAQQKPKRGSMVDNSNGDVVGLDEGEIEFSSVGTPGEETVPLVPGSNDSTGGNMQADNALEVV